MTSAFSELENGMAKLHRDIIILKWMTAAMLVLVFVQLVMTFSK